MKRECCMNCGHGEIVRYGDRRMFPQGVLCELVKVKHDPREALCATSGHCQHWKARAGK